MTFPGSFRFAPLGFVILRLMVGAVFLASGWRHLKNPGERSQSIGKSKEFTIFLGVAEIAGALGVILGILPQLAALGLIIILLGAIYEKAVVWQTGFWGEKTYGWHYDLMLLVMNLVILLTHGGPYVLTK
ncbi:MAG: DoxX family protein [Terriglobia bacterium]